MNSLTTVTYKRSVSEQGRVNQASEALSTLSDSASVSER